jgi:hypothetical protein
MSIKITVGAPVYNQTPPPSKQPPKDLYPIEKTFSHSQTIWTSIPFPDKLTIINEVRPEHFGAGFSPQTAESYGYEITRAFASKTVGVVAGKPHFNGTGFQAVQILFPPDNASVYVKLSRAPIKTGAVHRLAITLNPRALGETGFFDLLNQLSMATHFNLGSFMSDARVSRLDVAVDFVGLQICDLLVSVPFPNKRVLVVGTDEVVETVYLYKPIKLQKDGTVTKAGKNNPLGNLKFEIYDKLRERLHKGHASPFGLAPITRVEVKKERFGNVKFYLTDLAALKNPFEQVRLGHIYSAVTPMSFAWLAYAEARRGSGHRAAVFAGCLTKLEAEHFDAAYEKHQANVVDFEALWARWNDGIKFTGLNYLIEAAEQKCASVPVPEPTEGWEL